MIWNRAVFICWGFIVNWIWDRHHANGAVIAGMAIEKKLRKSYRVRTSITKPPASFLFEQICSVQNPRYKALSYPHQRQGGEKAYLCIQDFSCAHLFAGAVIVVATKNEKKQVGARRDFSVLRCQCQPWKSQRLLHEAADAP